MGYDISLCFFVCIIHSEEVGSPLGVLDYPHDVVRQVDLDVLLTVRNRSGQISKKVDDAHVLNIRYEGLCDIRRKTDLLRILGNHISVLPY